MYLQAQLTKMPLIHQSILYLHSYPLSLLSLTRALRRSGGSVTKRPSAGGGYGGAAAQLRGGPPLVAAEQLWRLRRGGVVSATVALARQQGGTAGGGSVNRRIARWQLGGSCGGVTLAHRRGERSAATAAAAVARLRGGLPAPARGTHLHLYARYELVL